MRGLQAMRGHRGLVDGAFGGGGGGAGVSVPLNWVEEQTARARALLNTGAAQQINWEMAWLIGRDPVVITGGGIGDDAALGGFIKEGGGGASGTVCFGRTATEGLIDSPKTSAWYVSTFLYLRNVAKVGKFTGAIQLVDVGAGNSTIEVTTKGTAGSSFALQPFIAGAAQPIVDCGAVGTPGSPSCPIGAGFTCALYNSPVDGVMGCEFNGVQAFRQFVLLLPNLQMAFHQYSTDDQMAPSVGAAFLAKVRP